MAIGGQPLAKAAAFERGGRRRRKSAVGFLHRFGTDDRAAR
jgi:hypothetical protein